MKYKLLKDLPLAKAGTEVFIHSPITTGLIDIRINEDDGYFNISCLKKEDIPEWLEEVKEHKTIYDLKDGDKYYYLNNNQIKVLMQSRGDGEFSHDANVYIFLTEREAKRNKLLRELATRQDKWLPDEGQIYTTFDNEGDLMRIIFYKECNMITYHLGAIFRDQEEYNKYMTEEAKNLLFNI